MNGKPVKTLMLDNKAYYSMTIDNPLTGCKAKYRVSAEVIKLFGYHVVFNVYLKQVKNSPLVQGV